MIMCEWANRFTSLEKDLDLPIDFEKVCDVEALEAAWSSLHD